MHVLVCDDDADVGGFLLKLFQIEGWTGEVVTSSAACLRSLQQGGRPDVLVLDQVMPELTGTEVAARARDLGYDRPIMLCSAYIGPELDADVDRLGLLPVNKIDANNLVRMASAAAAGSGQERSSWQPAAGTRAGGPART